MEAKPIESRALRVMCESRNVTLKELAARLGMKPGTLYEYADGKRIPPRSLLERATLALGYPLHHLDRTLAYLRHGDASILSAGSDPRGLAERELDSIALSLGLEWGEVFRDLMHRGKILALAFIERQTAPLLWARLRLHPPEARQAVVREKEEFRSWALSELVSHASIESASDEARQAVTLADLACVIADCLKDTEPLKLRTQGYARFHRGNALRVQGNLPASDEAFAQAHPLWKAGAAGDPERILNEARVLGMEASLRREQRHLPEALDLVNQALAADRNGETRFLLINRAKILEEMEDYEECIETLHRVLPLIDREREPRVLLNQRINLLVALCSLKRYDEAAAELEEVGLLALGMGERLNIVEQETITLELARRLRDDLRKHRSLQEQPE